MPRGRLPTGIVVMTFRAATSMTLISPPTSFVTKRRPPAGWASAAGAGAVAVPDEGASLVEHAAAKARERRKVPLTASRAMSTPRVTIVVGRILLFGPGSRGGSRSQTSPTAIVLR